VNASLLPGVYEGRVWHGRGGEPAHSFSQELAMVLLDVSRPGDLCRSHPLWSASERRPGLRWYRRSDYLRSPDGTATAPLDETVRGLVEASTGGRPEGPVLLLTQLRSLGAQFNPISCYFCYDAGGDRVEAMVAEVTNTPWHERHAYVIGPPGEHRLAKAMHVSPFLPMEQAYVVRYEQPGEHIAVSFDVEQEGATVMQARLGLERLGASHAALARAMWHYPTGTMAVSTGIYREAFHLWRKRAAVHRHPGRQERNWRVPRT
jgi:DUF1365 family protein